MGAETMTTKNDKKNPDSKEMQRRAKAQRDTRDPSIIWAEKVNSEFRLMAARFARLHRIGNAKRAKPTPEQYDAAAAWLQEQTAEAIEALGRKLKQPETVATPAPEAFSVVPGAPAKAYNAPKKQG